MKWTLVLAILALTGCASSKPQISDFNGDSVKIKVYCGMAYECTRPRPEDLAHAEQMCATRGRKAQFASSINKPEMSGTVSVDAYEHLYICV
jgi:hypothetical protein